VLKFENNQMARISTFYKEFKEVANIKADKIKDKIQLF
jgi:hypothetical protein